MALPDLNREFIIQTDASGVGLGVVLLQEVDGLECPIAFASRGLTPAEANYSVPQQECLAVIWAIKKFGQYIENTHFTIETDHQALRWRMQLSQQFHDPPLVGHLGSAKTYKKVGSGHYWPGMKKDVWRYSRLRL